MNFRELAKEILEYVGGSSNIVAFGHCSTRLRITIKDEDKINIQQLKNLKGVLKII